MQSGAIFVSLVLLAFCLVSGALAWYCWRVIRSTQTTNSDSDSAAPQEWRAKFTRGIMILPFLAFAAGSIIFLICAICLVFSSVW